MVVKLFVIKFFIKIFKLKNNFLNKSDNADMSNENCVKSQSLKILINKVFNVILYSLSESVPKKI